jgi:hypothetical protein
VEELASEEVPRAINSRIDDIDDFVGRFTHTSSDDISCINDVAADVVYEESVRS